LLRVDRERVLNFRLRASYLDRKLPIDSLAQAAAGGLQDSAPRAAIVSLHARVDGVGPSSWEDESLVQIWGPRGADYVVAREAIAAFTVGRLPRDPEQCKALEKIADKILGVLDGQARPTREVDVALPELGQAIRLASITGRVLIRWDASRIWAIPADPPKADVEGARIELARRFLRWFAPSSLERFTWWAGVEPADAKETWRGLESELVPVALDDERRYVLESDEGLLRKARPVSGVRLIPHGDPLIKIDARLVVDDPKLRLEIFPRPKTKSEFWPVSGGVLVDGRFIGSWARQQRRVTVNVWNRVSRPLREAIEHEALTLPISSRTKASVRWV
jgi:hypothetical protein